MTEQANADQAEYWNSPAGRKWVDHQATMGAYVGRTALRDGKGIMVDWFYADGSRYMPSDDERPGSQGDDFLVIRAATPMQT